MHAKIPRELHGAWRVCAMDDRTCDGCGRAIEDDELKYRCHLHNITYCVGCARAELGLPSVNYGIGGEILEIKTGDILFSFGNTDLVIHHAMLILDDMVREPLDPQNRYWLHLPPGVEVWGCYTIESSDQIVGKDNWWHPGFTLFTRDPFNEKAYIVGCIEEDGEFVLNEGPTPFKLLLNPVRKSTGGPGLDKEAFQEVVEEAKLASTKWAWNSGLAGNVLLKRGIYDPAQYQTPAKRAEFMQMVRKNWEHPHVCSGVPAQCWQRYFEHVYDDDEAAQYILQYMPLKASTIAPSQMVKELSKRGWALQDSFEPTGPGKLPTAWMYS